MSFSALRLGAAIFATLFVGLALTACLQGQDADCGCARAWPKLLIGVVPPPGFEGPETAALTRMIVRFPTGLTVDFSDRPPGCPAEIMNLPCSVEVYGGDSDTWMDLEVESLTGVVAQQHIEIRARNRCGKDVAHVAVIVEADGAVSITTPRYISPCP